MTIKELYAIFEQHPEVVTDSRKTQVGAMFFALRGENFNGNEFAEKAIESGCSYAVIDEGQYDDHSGRFIVVENVLKTLQELSAYHRIALGLPVIGITGTNGKTTTKELLSAVLGRRFNLWHTQGNLNNQIGVPLTLLSLRKEHQMAVVEMGANHPGDIKELVELVAPNVGLITNVGRAHLQGFGSFEGVVKTKCELYDFIRNTDGSVFVNADNSILMEHSEGINRVTYGINCKDGIVSGEVTGNSPFLQMRFQVTGDNNIHDLQTNLVGVYNAENVMAAICVGTYFGIEPGVIKSAIEGYVPTNNRSQYKKTERNALIIDAYNANPTSMTASIKNFEAVKMEDKSLILGEMRELGQDSAVEHQKIIDLLVTNGLTDVCLVGTCWDNVKTTFKRYATTEDLIADLKSNPVADKTILIKGSNGNHLDRVVEWL